MSNLFSALHKYYQREDHTPQENQITEMFAQVLKHEPGFAKHVFSKWFPFHSPLISPVAETQVSVRLLDDGKSPLKFIDLVLYDTVNDRRELAYVIEVKWWSGENWSPNERGDLVPQTANYDTFIKQNKSENLPVGKLYLTRRVESAHDGWVARRWADVYNEAQAYRRARLNSRQTFGQGLLLEFIHFLENEGVKENPMNITDITHFESVIRVCKRIDTVFRQVQLKMSESLGAPVAAKSFRKQLLEQMVNQDRIALYWYAHASVHIVCGIYASAEQFEEKEGIYVPLIRGVPVLSTTVIANPGSREYKQCVECDALARLKDEPGWHVVDTSASSYAIAHRTITFLDLYDSNRTAIQDFTSATIQFFGDGLTTLKKSGLIEYLQGQKAGNKQHKIE